MTKRNRTAAIAVLTKAGWSPKEIDDVLGEVKVVEVPKPYPVPAIGVPLPSPPSSPLRPSPWQPPLRPMFPGYPWAGPTLSEVSANGIYD